MTSFVDLAEPLRVALRSICLPMREETVGRPFYRMAVTSR